MGKISVLIGWKTICNYSLFSYTTQENQTLPIGPDEESELWRAQNRLGYSILGAWGWADFKKEGSFVTLLSRCADKTSKYTHVWLEKVLQTWHECGYLDQVDEVVLWHPLQEL